MIPSKHSRSLYFTPRTPWGRLPQNRAGQSRNYLRASQDKPLDSSGKDAQGLAGGMAPNQFGGKEPGLPGQISHLDWGNAAPQSLSGQRPHDQLDGNGGGKLEFHRQQLPQAVPQPRHLVPQMGKGPIVPQSHGPRLDEVYSPPAEKRGFRFYAGAGANGAGSKLEEIPWGFGMTNGEPGMPDMGVNGDPQNSTDYDKMYELPKEEEGNFFVDSNPTLPAMQNPFRQPQASFQGSDTQPYSPSNPQFPSVKKPFNQQTPAPPTLQSSPFNQSYQPNRLKPRPASKK